MTTTETSSQLGEVRLYIDGELRAAASGKTFDNVNPANEQILGQAADADADDMDAAIAAARRAFDETNWATDHEFRQRCLLQLQEALESDAENIRAEVIAEAGAPVLSTYGPQVDWPLADGVRWPAEHITEFQWDRTLPDAEAFGAVSHRQVWKEATGVVGAICPWNFPFEVTINKVGQALATGNTLIVKPAPDTPWSGTRLGRLVAEHTDIPAGVFNVVTSTDHMIGEQLVVDPRVDLISFTGSTVTGRRILEKAIPTLKRTFLELGGKSAMLVLDDADLEAVLPSASFSCIHAGQGCALQTRILVPRSRYAEATEILTEAIKAVGFGQPTDPSVLAGPLISEKQRRRVLGYIDKGKAEGARITTGGGIPADQPKGFFVEPTVFVDVDNDMTIAREEIFGPVVALIAHDGDDDAVRIANDNEYGLSGGVFSASREHALAITRRLRIGSAQVNGGSFYGADSPYGGYKASGLGRQNGIEGFEQYLQTKAIGYSDELND